MPIYFLAALVLSCLPNTIGVAMALTEPQTGPNIAQTPVDYDAWIYPDAAGAMQTVATHSDLNAIKAEYLHIEDDGSLTQFNQSEEYPNGYSPQNVQILKEHSRGQYITISGSPEGTALAMQNGKTIPGIVNFASDIGFNVELDWEDFGSWTPEYYQQFKTFLGSLHQQLQDRGLHLMVDGPPIYDQTSQDWYQWKYEEVAPLVDYVVMMVYDNQYDTGAGNPIAPVDWSLNCMKWLKDKAGSKGIAGVAAYGYTGQNGRIAVNTSDGVKRRLTTLASSLPTRNAAGELVVNNGDSFYDYADTQTMKVRLHQVEQSGLTRLSVWSLGDNPWFE